MRLVLDRNHRSMCIVRQIAGNPAGRVIGGICFRPFPTQVRSLTHIAAHVKHATFIDYYHVCNMI